MSCRASGWPKEAALVASGTVDAVAEPETLHSISGRVLTVACTVTAVIAVVGIALDGGWQGLLNFGALPLLFAGLVWALFDQPYVRVTDGGVEICNIVRTVEIPWPAVTDIDLQWGLRLVTRLGNVSAWSVPPPSRPRARLSRNLRSGTGQLAGPQPVRPASPQDRRTPSHAAQTVVNRWHTLQQEGHLDDPRLESDRPVKHWNRTQLSVLTVLILLSAAGVLGYRFG